jgi:hypothetical protein
MSDEALKSTWTVARRRRVSDPNCPDSKFEQWLRRGSAPSGRQLAVQANRSKRATRAELLDKLTALMIDVVDVYDSHIAHTPHPLKVAAAFERARRAVERVGDAGNRAEVTRTRTRGTTVDVTFRSRESRPRDKDARDGE